MIYFISDFHLFHKNIIEYAKRPFKDVVEMNSHILKQWNSIVTPEDDVMFLGDFLFYKEDYCKEILDKFNGNKHLIIGNHDRKKVVQCESWSYTGNSCSFEHSETGHLICLQHRPFVNQEFDPKKILIHGHTHGYHGLINNNQIDVSCEAINYTPISIDDIIKLWMKHCEEMNESR